MESGRKVAKNAFWLVACKIAQSVLGIVVTMFTARYLGPSNYGLINYAASLVAFLTPVSLLGFDAILVYEIVSDKEHDEVILGTSILASLFASLLCIGGILAFVYIQKNGDPTSILVCFLYSLIMLFQSLGLIQYWFQAKLLSKYSAIVMFIAYVVMAGYKILLLVLQTSIVWFALANVLDAFLISISLSIIYYRKTKKVVCFSGTCFKKMFSASKHFVLANLMISVCSQIDKIMINIFIGDASTGLYSAALTCATMTSFFFVAVINSFRPVILERASDDNSYNENTIRLFSIVVYFSIFQSIVMTIASKLIIRILYGDSYLDAANILCVLTWYTTFSYLGSVRGIWLLGKNKTKYISLMSILAAVINVFLNLLFINLMGMIGAAIASLITQFMINVIIPLLIPALRPTNALVLKSLNPSYLIQMIKLLLGKRHTKEE